MLSSKDWLCLQSCKCVFQILGASWSLLDGCRDRSLVPTTPLSSPKSIHLLARGQFPYKRGNLPISSLRPFQVSAAPSESDMPVSRGDGWTHFPFLSPCSHRAHMKQTATHAWNHGHTWLVADSYFSFATCLSPTLSYCPLQEHAWEDAYLWLLERYQVRAVTPRIC